MANPFIIRQPPEGTPVLSVPLHPDCDGHGIADYVITHKPPLRRGMPDRFNVSIVLRADGRCLNDNIPIATEPTLAAAIRRADPSPIEE